MRIELKLPDDRRQMTIKDLKVLINSIPEEFDGKDLWYVDFSGYSDDVSAFAEDTNGVSIS